MTCLCSVTLEASVGKIQQLALIMAWGGKDVLESSGGIFIQMSNRWRYLSAETLTGSERLHMASGVIWIFSQYGSTGTYMVEQGSKSWIYITFLALPQEAHSITSAPSIGYWGSQKPAKIQRERVYTPWWEACQRNSSQFLKLPYLFHHSFSTHNDVLSTPLLLPLFSHLRLSGKGKATLRSSTLLSSPSTTSPSQVHTQAQKHTYSHTTDFRELSMFAC